MTVMARTDTPTWGAWARGSDEEAATRPLTPRAIHRAAVESGGLAFALPPVLFILIPISVAWWQDPGPGAVAVTLLLPLYALLFVYATGIGLYPPRVRLAWFAEGTALLLLLIPVLGANVLFMVMFQAMTHVLLLPWRWAVPTMLLMSLGVVVLAVVFEVYIAAGLAVMGTVMAWGIGYGVRQQILQEQ